MGKYLDSGVRVVVAARRAQLCADVVCTSCGLYPVNTISVKFLPGWVMFRMKSVTPRLLRDRKVEYSLSSRQVDWDCHVHAFFFFGCD
jgi:hypothetical protein